MLDLSETRSREANLLRILVRRYLDPHHRIFDSGRWNAWFSRTLRERRKWDFYGNWATVARAKLPVLKKWIQDT